MVIVFKNTDVMWCLILMIIVDDWFQKIRPKLAETSIYVLSCHVSIATWQVSELSKHFFDVVLIKFLQNQLISWTGTHIPLNKKQGAQTSESNVRVQSVCDEHFVFDLGCYIHRMNSMTPLPEIIVHIKDASGSVNN